MSVKAEETQWRPLEMAVVFEGGGNGEGRGLMLQEDGGLGPVLAVLFTSWDLGQISHLPGTQSPHRSNESWMKWCLVSHPALAFSDLIKYFPLKSKNLGSRLAFRDGGNNKGKRSDRFPGFVTMCTLCTRALSCVTEQNSVPGLHIDRRRH